MTARQYAAQAFTVALLHGCTVDEAERAARAAFDQKKRMTR